MLARPGGLALFHSIKKKVMCCLQQIKIFVPRVLMKYDQIADGRETAVDGGEPDPVSEDVIFDPLVRRENIVLQGIREQTLSQ